MVGECWLVVGEQHGVHVIGSHLAGRAVGGGGWWLVVGECWLVVLLSEGSLVHCRRRLHKLYVLIKQPGPRT